MENIDLNPQRFVPAGVLSWDEVFEAWRLNEEHQDKWKDFLVTRGFTSWREWRGRYATFLGLSKLSWEKYTLDEPTWIVPAFRGGPFRSWVENVYAGERLPLFADLAKTAFIREHKGIADIMRNFPAETTLIGIATERGIVIIEGMHRCCAIALAAREKIQLNTKITLLVAEYDAPGFEGGVLEKIHQISKTMPRTKAEFDAAEGNL